MVFFMTQFLINLTRRKRSGDGYELSRVLVAFAETLVDVGRLVNEPGTVQRHEAAV